MPLETEGGERKSRGVSMKKKKRKREQGSHAGPYGGALGPPRHFSGHAGGNTATARKGEGGKTAP